jgi:hypothetical protein
VERQADFSVLAARSEPSLCREAPISRPSTATVDLRASKRFHFGESMSIEVLGEAFNLFNRSNFTGITDTLYTFTAATNTLTFSPTYLTPTTINNTINYTPRQVQIGVRFHF